MITKPQELHSEIKITFVKAISCRKEDFNQYNIPKYNSAKEMDRIEKFLFKLRLKTSNEIY